MKKFALLFLSILIVGAFALPVAAVPVDDLTVLADYFPEDTPVYAATRIDDEYIDTLDVLIEQVAAALPSSELESLRDALDMLASRIDRGSTFAESIRPWLGDVAAFGIMPLAQTDRFNEPIALIAVSITDREAAEAYFNEAIPSNAFEVTEENDYTLYEEQNGNRHFVFRDDVILLASDLSALENGAAQESALRASDAFAAALDLLPESDYNGVIYLDTPALVETAMLASMKEMMDELEDAEIFGQQMQTAMQMMDFYRAQAIGLTILDERSLTLDFAAPVNMAALEGFMVDPFQYAANPVNLDLAHLIPAGTPLVAFGTNLRDSYDAVLENINTLFEMQQDMDAAMERDFQDFQTAIWGLEFLVRGFTGLELREDILEWMDGTYAFYLRLSPTASDASNIFAALQEFPIDFGLVVEVTDGAGAQTLMANLVSALSDLPANPAEDVTVTTEQINGADAVSILIETNSIPESVELMVGGNDEVFVFGTRRAVEAALDPNAGLDADPAFAEALQYALTDTYSLMYMSGEGLLPIARLIESSGEDAEEAAAAVEGVFSLIGSASVSGVLVGEDGVLARAVLTLPAQE